MFIRQSAFMHFLKARVAPFTSKEVQWGGGAVGRSLIMLVLS